MSQKPILELQQVSKHFHQSSSIIDELKNTIMRREQESIRAVDGVSLSISETEAQGIIGESGCGKSTLLKVIASLHNSTDGDIIYKGTSVSTFDKSDWKQYRRNVQIIFQDPFNVMNPKFTVREALEEPLNIHNPDIEDREERIHQMLERVELSPSSQYIDRQEPQLSGGEKQRVAIARALILEPDVVLADEPVSMLDVSTQAAILNLLAELIEDFNIALLYISHDLSTVPYVCDKTNVMYLGRIVESAPTDQLLENPKHPYTQELMKAIPVPDPHVNRDRTQLQGSAADPVNLPSGCRFKDRCPERMEICDTKPAFESINENEEHRVACHLHNDTEGDDIMLEDNKKTQQGGHK